MGTGSDEALIHARMEEVKERISELQGELVGWRNILRKLEHRPTKNVVLNPVFKGTAEAGARFPSIIDGIWSILKEASEPMTTAQIVEALNARRKGLVFLL